MTHVQAFSNPINGCMRILLKEITFLCGSAGFSLMRSLRLLEDVV